MNYKKTICIYNDDEETVKFKFDIVLNREIAFDGLKEFPSIADVLVNGINAQNGESEKELVYNSIISGDIEKIFALNEDIPKLIAYIFPKMLAKGKIEVGSEKEIMEFVEEYVYDDDFIKSMTDFFMVVFSQKERKPTKKVKMTMN